MGAQFDLRLVAYQPLGARIGVLPDQGFTITATPSGPTLTAQVSRQALGQVGVLGRDVEIAVESWRENRSLTAFGAGRYGTGPFGDNTSGSWVEGRDSRFAVTIQTYDDRDPAAIVTLNGIGLAAWLLAGAALYGVAYYSRTDAKTESAAAATISVSGETWTWSGNPIGVGDRVRIVDKGHAKNINTGSIYYAHDLSGNSFKLTRNASGNGAYINAGVASNVKVARVVTRLIIPGHKFTQNQAVKTTAAAAEGLSDTTTYYVTNPSTNSVQLASQPGGTPLDLQVGSDQIGTIYTDVDGQRVFNNAHPGTIMSTVFLEARARGWGVNPTDSTQQMSHSWTVGNDSTGAAWSVMADDPSTPGISCSFQPGTPATQMLQFLMDNQYAEWFASGRTIGLVNYGTGNDHTVDKNPPVRIGRTATSVPITVDLSAERNSYTVRGYGAVYVQEQAATIGPWGVLEDYQTVTGMSSRDAAVKLATNSVSLNQSGQKGYSVTENAQAADFLPTIDYSRGDWVAAQVDSNTWTRLRVSQWSFTKAPTGVISVTTSLEYVKRDLLAKVSRAQVATSAGLSDAGTSSSPALESDNRKATYPLGITVTQVGKFAADDSATSVATISWSPVSADDAGNPINVTEYQVWLREDGAQGGYSAATTAGLTVDLPPLPSGRYYEVSVRAQSDTGQWGQLSPEVEFLTVYPLDVPNPPSAPALSGKLGQVRVAWDGNLIDPTNGAGAPDHGFAYVQALYSTTSSGPWTQVGLNMGNAGFTSISGLTIGTTYWFALQAVNVVGVVSAISDLASFTVVGVQGPDIEANSVTANTIAVGAISADKLDLGSVPQGSPVDRVPMAIPNVAFWSKVIAGGVAGFGASPGCTSTSGGIVQPNGGNFLQITPSGLPVPASGKIIVTVLGNAYNPFVQVWDSTGTPILNPAGDGTWYTASKQTFTFPAGAATYDVMVPNWSGATTTIVAAHVFEVIGNGGGGQAAELSPQGLRLFDNNGNLAVDLTTSTSQYLTIVNSTSGDPATVAAIDQTGNAQFNEVSANASFDFQGVLLTDPNDPEGILNAAPNGSTWNPATVPILERFGRGVIYDVTWPSQNGSTISTTAQYQRIAQDQFTLEDGRNYEFVLQDGGLQTTAPNVNAYLELQLNTTPNANPTSGLAVMRAVIYANNNGYWSLPPVVFAASANQVTVDAVNRLLPAGVPLYWQLNTNLSSAPSGSWTWSEFGNTRGLTIIDVGSARLSRPINGADPLADVHDYTSSGSSSGTTSSGTTASSKTVTFYANQSRTWNQSGSNIVTGTGQWTNGAAMYVGTGVTPMGSWFGNFRTSSGASLASVLSGKTITAATLTLKCNYTYSSSGSTVPMGTGSMTSAPATIGAPSNNTFNVSVKGGTSKSIGLNSTIRSGLASGGVGSFVIGVASGGAGVYSIFAGATQSSAPKLVITFH